MTADPAAHFRDMAERISRNDPSEFAGAILVVPPGGGEPISLCLVRPNHDLALFWSTAVSMITIAGREFEERARSNDPFRR